MYFAKMVQEFVPIYPQADEALQVLGWGSLAGAFLTISCGVIPAILLLVFSKRRKAAITVLGLSLLALLALALILSAHITIVSAVWAVLDLSIWQIPFDAAEVGEGYYGWYSWFIGGRALGIAEVVMSIWLLFVALKLLQAGRLFKPLQSGEFQTGVTEFVDGFYGAKRSSDSKRSGFASRVLSKITLPILVWLLLYFVVGVALNSYLLWIATAICLILTLVFGALLTIELCVMPLIVAGLLSALEVSHYCIWLPAVLMVVVVFIWEWVGKLDKGKLKYQVFLVAGYLIIVAWIVSVDLYGASGAIILAAGAASAAIVGVITLAGHMFDWFSSDASS